MSHTPAPDPLLDFYSEDDPGTPPRDDDRQSRPAAFAARLLRTAHGWRTAVLSATRGQLIAALGTAGAIVLLIGFTLARPAQRAPSAPPAPPSAATSADISLPSQAGPVATAGSSTPPAPSTARTSRTAARAAAHPAAASSARARGEEKPAPGSLGGFLTVATSVDLEIHEGGRLLGTTSVARLMMPVGPHHLEIGSSELGYTATRTVTIAAGQVATVKLEVPTSTLNVNARPWATVSIDGREVGQTPLANVAVPIGRHEVVFRHPELGERRQAVVVSLNGPNRVGVDFSR